MVVNIKHSSLRKGQFITHLLSTGVGGRGEECGKKESVAGLFAVKYKTGTKPNKEDYGVDGYFFLL